MTELRKCDRCGDVVPAADSEDIYAMRETERENSQNATYPDMHRGKLVQREITPSPVDLYSACRQDLRDFFRNVRVEPRHRG